VVAERASYLLSQMSRAQDRRLDARRRYLVQQVGQKGSTVDLCEHLRLVCHNGSEPGTQSPGEDRRG
jgi:hypothetical protein